MVNIQRLIDCDWDYVQAVERSVGKAISEILCNTFAGDEVNRPYDDPILTTGNNPNYDFSINKGTFELKCSNTPNILKIEYQSNGRPSGICTSSALYYVFINPGSAKMNDQWCEVEKLRIIPRQFLIHRVINMAKQTDPVSSDGAKWFTLDAKSLPNDGWIADVDVKTVGNQHTSNEVVTQIYKQGKPTTIESIGLGCSLGVLIDRD